jgi:hypothetical protein
MTIAGEKSGWNIYNMHLMGTMALEGYISALEKYKHLDSNINIQTSLILLEFSHEEHLSAYKIYTRIKNDTDRTKAYKNINKHVKRLESLEFIVPVKLRSLKNIHAAKHYRISEAGMFHLFYPHNIVWVFLIPKILENYRNYSIFETLVYPYFKRETLAAINQTINFQLSINRFRFFYILHVIDAIYGYLKNCCMEIHRFMYNKPYTNIDYATSGVHIHEVDRNHAEELEDLDIKITKLKDDLILKILLGFQYQYPVQMDMDPIVRDPHDIYTILAQDDKFMNNVDDLQKGFKMSLKIARRLRNRS